MNVRNSKILKIKDIVITQNFAIFLSLFDLQLNTAAENIFYKASEELFSTIIFAYNMLFITTDVYDSFNT